MTLVDANVLLYAVNTDAEHHVASRRWLDGALSGRDTVAFAWIALLAFVRLVTKPELFPRPLTVDQAMDRVHAWLSAALAAAGGAHRPGSVSRPGGASPSRPGLQPSATRGPAAA